jgi:hypothetical protein
MQAVGLAAIERGISMNINKINSNPVLIQGDKSQEGRHYRCLLSKQGTQVDVYITSDPEETPPTLSDVLKILAMDAYFCGIVDGLDEFMVAVHQIGAGSKEGLGPMEDFYSEYQNRRKQVERIREFLGNSAFGELLKQHTHEEDSLKTVSGGRLVKH